MIGKLATPASEIWRHPTGRGSARRGRRAGRGQLVEGDARFVDGPALDVDGRRIEARHYLVATGADAAVSAVPGLAESGYLTSTTAMELTALPESLLVIGGGYVAMDQAQLFAHLGTKVTMLVRSTIARGEEPEVAQAIRDAFLGEGIVGHEGLVSDRVGRDGDQVVLDAGEQQFHAEHLLVATGRRPRTAGLGLEEVGVRLGAGGEVVVDADLSTSHPRVWGAGDVTGHPQFVYVAAKHGGLVVESAFERAGHRIDYSALPRITFTNPTIASARLTEAQARQLGLDCECRVLGLEHVPRAIVSRNERGVVKLVSERDSGRIVGAPRRRRRRRRHPCRKHGHRAWPHGRAAVRGMEPVPDARRGALPGGAFFQPRPEQAVVLRGLMRRELVIGLAVIVALVAAVSAVSAGKISGAAGSAVSVSGAPAASSGTGQEGSAIAVFDGLVRGM